MAKGRHRFSGPKYANGNHKSQQKAYVRTEKGKRIARNATRLNRKLGTYGNGDNLDSAHYEGSTTRGRSQHESINRASRTKKKNKKQTSHHLTMAKEKKNKWKNRLKKAELLISPVAQGKFVKNVAGKEINKLKKNKTVQNVVKGAKDFGKKVKKTVQDVNPKSEINQKINKKKAEISKGNVKAKSQLSALQRKKSGKSISDVRAENERKMRENAKKRHEAWKAKRKKNRK